jgi:hypothetical protein
MADIKLNFINHSNDLNNSEIVIFQKNATALATHETAVAWRVIRNCGAGDNHPFIYPMATSVAAADSWGNYTPQMNANPGDLFEMIRSSSGDTLQYKGADGSTEEIGLLNNLDSGAISANIYKDGKLLATKTGIAPGQQTAFLLRPTIFIGAASEVEEGAIVNNAIVSSVNTEISLLGLSSADIVMTGGGPGPNATPLRFTLQNIAYS